MINMLKVLILSFCLQVSSIYASEFIFRILDLGTLQTDSSAAFAINDNNQLVGKYELDNIEYFFLWENGKIKLIDLPPRAIPKAINNNCQICGQYITDAGCTRGFIFDLEIGFLDLGSLGGSNSWVEDMNESGEIVGYSETGKMSNIRSEFKEIHAFIWKNGEIRDLNVLKGDIGQGGDESRAFGINDHGDIVGYSNYTFVHKGKKLASAYKACMWQEDKLIEIFPNDPLAFISQAFDINNKNEVIALTQLKYDYYELNYVDLSTMKKSHLAGCGGGPYIPLKKINNSSIMIGSPHTSSNVCCIGYPSSRHGTGYRQIPLASDFTWKHLKQVRGININNIIVGEAENIYGEVHGIILLPEVDET